MFPFIAPHVREFDPSMQTQNKTPLALHNSSIPVKEKNVCCYRTTSIPVKE